MPRYLLKLSGEALGETGFDAGKAAFFAAEVNEARALQPDLQLAILVGGGNLWRGRDAAGFGFAPAIADQIGIAATVLNGLVLSETLRAKGLRARVFSPWPLAAAAAPHDIVAETDALQAGEIVVFAGGTGNPFFTTDTAAVLRGLEIGAQAVLKGTKVAGVFDADPHHHPTARKYDRLAYDEALARDLKVMDATAFALAREHRLPIFVFDAFTPGNITAALSGSASGTWVGRD
jgi:uridylate kinase